jgi:hypothetical protein
MIMVPSKLVLRYELTRLLQKSSYLQEYHFTWTSQNNMSKVGFDSTVSTLRVQPPD